MEKLFNLYYRTNWGMPILMSCLWLAFFYKFFHSYAINPIAWWAPSLIPIVIYSVFRTILYTYYLLNKNSFFKGITLEFIQNNDSFSLKEFSSFTNHPQPIAHYFLIKSKKVFFRNEESCLFYKNSNFFKESIDLD